MRSLRTGNGLGDAGVSAAASTPASGELSHGPATEDPSSATQGLAADEASFRAKLEQVIALASQRRQQVLVFCLRGSVKGLQRWSDTPTANGRDGERAVEELLIGSGRGLSLCRQTDGDLLGFDVEPTDAVTAERLGGRLMTELAKPLGEPGRHVVLSPRLGVCVHDPDRGGADQAIEAATMTAAQTNFETPFLLYNQYIAERAQRLNRTSTELPKALEAGLISVGFQPRVTFADRMVIGIESLARWDHPERGSIPAPEFLEVAERDGKLIELGDHSRSQAVAAARSWTDDGHFDNGRLWLNVAPLELCNPDLPASMAELMNDRPYVPLGIEVTESRLLEDLVFLRIFDRLQETGVQLALDNFNPVTESFGRVKRLPISLINLDGELVRSLPSVAANRDLVRFTCSLAESRGISVTACGVETDEQLEVAELCGADLAQGYAISKVLPGPSMADYLAGVGPFGTGTGRRSL